MDVPRPLNIYLLYQAGFGNMEYKGKQVGSVQARFANGQKIETQLVLGENIRDWALSNPRAVTTLSSASVQLAWQGVDSASQATGVVDMLTLDVPPAWAETALTGFQITDTSTLTTGAIDPCVMLVAMTVRYLR